MRRIFMFAIVAAALMPVQALAGVPAFPVRSDSIYLSFFVPRTTFEGDFKTLDAGEGAGVRLGFSKANILSTQFSAFKSRHDLDTDTEPNKRAAFSGIALDLKLSLPLFPVVAPYGFIGLGRYVIEKSDVVYRSSDNPYGINGYQRGFGLDLYLAKEFSVYLGYTGRRIRFDFRDPDDDKEFLTVKTKATTYDFGATVHFY